MEMGEIPLRTYSREGEYMRWCIGMLLAALTIGLIVSVGEAGDPGKKGKLNVEAIFKKLDTNSDDKLSKEEFVKLAERFKDKEKARIKLTMAYDKIDPQNIGLSRDVFQKYLDSVRKKDNNK